MNSGMSPPNPNPQQPTSHSKVNTGTIVVADMEGKLRWIRNSIGEDAIHSTEEFQRRLEVSVPTRIMLTGSMLLENAVSTFM
jgi:hypothetical protein